MSQQESRSPAAPLVALLLLGTALRLAWGLRTEAYLQAPDMLAWGLLLADESAGLRADRLLHYPHEGGSALIGALAWLLGRETPLLPPLAWATLTLEAVGRGAASWLVLRRLGPRGAVAFAALVALGPPLLLPWGTLAFGMHGQAAMLPVLLLLAHSGGGSTGTGGAVRHGVGAGLAVALCYDAAVVLPAALALALREPGDRLRRAGYWTLGAGLGVLPHVLVRGLLDLGFALVTASDGGAASATQTGVQIRGVDLSLAAPLERLAALPEAAFDLLPRALLLQSEPAAAGRALGSVWWVACGVAVVAAMVDRQRRAMAAAATATLLLFLLAWHFGPFHPPVEVPSVAVAFRHVAFILPTACLLLALGIERRPGRFACGIALLLGLWGAGQTLAASTTGERPLWREAGWVLAQKIGHAPGRLVAVVEAAPADARVALVEGVGGGLAEATLANRSVPAPGARARYDAAVRGLGPVHCATAVAATVPWLRDSSGSAVSAAWRAELERVPTSCPSER